MASEFEVKYRSSPRAMAALKAACGPFETITMETTYYDAADGALSAGGRCGGVWKTEKASAP